MYVVWDTEPCTPCVTASCGKVIEISPRDQCLDKWTEKLDEAVLACGMPEMHLDKVEMSLATRSELLKELQDALGQSWLSILLARSKRLSWTGGGTIHIPVGPELSDPDRRERSRSRSRHSGSSSSCELMRDAEDADADAPKRKVRKMAASAASATASASAAAASPCDDAERSAQTEEELREWLRAADYTGKGILQKYEEKLVKEMEGKKSNLLVFVNESEEKSALARIDKLFWDTIACHQTGHKLVIAKAMKKLYEEDVENPWKPSELSRRCLQKTSGREDQRIFSWTIRPRPKCHSFLNTSNCITRCVRNHLRP